MAQPKTLRDSGGPVDLTTELKLDKGPSQSLSLHLSRILKGNTEVYRTPFLKGWSVEELQTHLDRMFEMANESTGQKLEAMLETLELNQRKKIGPRSIAKPWSERIVNVDEYFSSYTGSVSFKTSSATGNLRPVKVDTAIQSLKNTTSSGLPFLRKKGVVKFIYKSDRFERIYWRDDPCMMYTRTQELGKTRIVWGFPMADTIVEMMYFLPLLQYQKRLPWRAALVGPSAVDDEVTRLFHLSQMDDRELVSIDFNLYDASVKPELQLTAQNYIQSKFQDISSNLTGGSALPHIFNRISNIGLVTPDGVRDGPHGVPSGSTFTNEIDSIVQKSVSEITVNNDEKTIQGDDGLYSTHDPDRLFRDFESAGLSVSHEKSYTSKDYCVFLQNYYSRGYSRDGKLVGVYPLYRAWNRLVFMERWQDFQDFELEGRDYFSIRAISILENCRNHPYFEDFVLMVANLDKYKLKFTNKGLTLYQKMWKDSKGAGDLIKNQYGDDITGLSSFRTVRLLREKVW
jgi:hypothetical protein